MKKLILLSIIIVFSGILKAQTFPYLNASTGNEGQYIVDADTNIFMYHDNQLEKYDKNFNSIWVKKYSGLNFCNLLLSKTGSIYFIASDSINPYLKNVIGKLNYDGSLSWCKQYESPSSSNQEQFCQIMLDRNNNLVVSGNANISSLPCSNAWFLKLDTLGNILLSKRFEVGGGVCFKKFVIVEDDQGIYRFIGDYSFFETGGLVAFKYDQINDSLTSIGFLASIGQHESINASMFCRSKYDTSVYYSMHSVIGGPTGAIIKYKKDSIIWSIGFNISNWAYFIDGFDEDNLQNIIYTISTPYKMNFAFENYGVKISSNCTYLQRVQYFNNFYFSPPNLAHISGKIHYLYDNKYLYSLSGSNFGALTYTPLDSNLNSNCATETTYTISGTGGNFMGLNTLPTQIINDITTYTNITPTVTAVNNFSLNTDYCLLTSSQEIKKETKKLSIQPNPANNVLNIVSSDDLIEVTVLDITGKIILIQNHRTTIDISDLNSGMYFIKIKTDQGEFSQKFIKE